MQFRVVMNHQTAKWEVQLARFAYFGWRSLPKEFNSFYEAELWVDEQGLQEAYRYHDQRYSMWLPFPTHQQWPTTATKHPSDSSPKTSFDVRPSRLQQRYAN